MAVPSPPQTAIIGYRIDTFVGAALFRPQSQTRVDGTLLYKWAGPFGGDATFHCQGRPTILALQFWAEQP